MDEGARSYSRRELEWHDVVYNCMLLGVLDLLLRRTNLSLLEVFIAT